MSGLRILALAVLAAGALLHGTDADAQARQQIQVEYQAEPPVEMDVWLRRLVGRFSFEGVVHVPSNGECGAHGASLITMPCQTIKGTGDCVSVGRGPGVQCMLNVSWHEIWTSVSSLTGLVETGMDSFTSDFVPGALPYLNPAMVQFGLDPRTAAINHLLVDHKGLAEGGLGSETGSRATFRTACVNQPGILGGCERIFRIEARADSRLLYMWIDVEKGPKGIGPPFSSIMLTLRRVTPEQK